MDTKPAKYFPLRNGVSVLSRPRRHESGEGGGQRPFPAVDFPHSQNWECSRTACSRAGWSVSDTRRGEGGSSPPLRPLPRLPHLTLLSGRPLMDAAAAAAA